MRVEVVGKNGFNVGKRTEDYVEKKLQKIDQFFGSEVIDVARVVLKAYATYYAVEVTIPAKSLILRAEVKDPDLFGAVDKVVDKLLAQVRKRKDRVKNKLEKEGIKEVYRNNELDIEDIEKDIMAGQLVKNKEIDLVPMTTEEALDQMELLGHDFFVFLNKGNHKVCVAYLRDDGNYAIIETNNQ